MLFADNLPMAVGLDIDNCGGCATLKFPTKCEMTTGDSVSVV